MLTSCQSCSDTIPEFEAHKKQAEPLKALQDRQQPGTAVAERHMDVLERVRQGLQRLCLRPVSHRI